MGRLLIQFAGTNTTKALSETLPQNTIIVDEDLHQLRLHDGTTPGGHIIGGSGGGGVPVGTIIPFAGNSIPEGYLLCDGSAISRTDYATLFAVIGTIYGSGDGNSTFNLPSANERFVVAKQDATDANNYTWYRLYNDGFVEQGGRTYKSGGGTVSVVLPIKMANANYVVLRNQKGNSFQSYYPTWVAGLNPTQTQTGFDFYSASTTGYDYWETSGTAAIIPTYNKIQCIKYI